jgi:tetratricopeptide (TPR) repeat protein
MAIRRFVVAALLTLVGLLPAVAGQSIEDFEPIVLVDVARLNGSADIGKVLEWVDAAYAHRPGQIDEALQKVASWPPQTLATTLTDAVSLLRLCQYLDTLRDGQSVEYRGHKLRAWLPAPPAPLEPAENIFDTLHITYNDFTHGAVRWRLTRGALLQTDLAMYVSLGGSVNAARNRNSNMAIHVSDGEVGEMQDAGPYWRDAQFVVEAIDRRPVRTPDPRTEPLVSLWYRTTSAWAAYQGRWSDAGPLLRRGLELFPKDVRLLFDAGVMHEAFAEPGIQHAAQNLVRSGAITSVTNLAAELAAAKAHLEQSIAGDSELNEAHLHLGQVLGRLGQHTDAIRELTVAERTLHDPELRYDAALVLAREQAATGDRETARASYQRAASEFPLAQSPQMGLSELSRLDGNGAAAVSTLASLFAQPRNGADDPWWGYIKSHARDGLVMLSVMRAAFLKEGQQ